MAGSKKICLRSSTAYHNIQSLALPVVVIYRLMPYTLPFSVSNEKKIKNRSSIMNNGFAVNEKEGYG